MKESESESKQTPPEPKIKEGKDLAKKLIGQSVIFNKYKDFSGIKIEDFGLGLELYGFKPEEVISNSIELIEKKLKEIKKILGPEAEELEKYETDFLNQQQSPPRLDPEKAKTLSKYLPDLIDQAKGFIKQNEEKLDKQIIEFKVNDEEKIQKLEDVLSRRKEGERSNIGVIKGEFDEILGANQLMASALKYVNKGIKVKSIKDLGGEDLKKIKDSQIKVTAEILQIVYDKLNSSDKYKEDRITKEEMELFVEIMHGVTSEKLNLAKQGKASEGKNDSFGFKNWKEEIKTKLELKLDLDGREKIDKIMEKFQDISKQMQFESKGYYFAGEGRGYKKSDGTWFSQNEIGQRSYRFFKDIEVGEKNELKKEMSSAIFRNSSESEKKALLLSRRNSALLSDGDLTNSSSLGVSLTRLPSMAQTFETIDLDKSTSQLFSPPMVTPRSNSLADLQEPISPPSIPTGDLKTNDPIISLGPLAKDPKSESLTAQLITTPLEATNSAEPKLQARVSVGGSPRTDPSSLEELERARGVSVNVTSLENSLQHKQLPDLKDLEAVKTRVETIKDQTIAIPLSQGTVTTNGILDYTSRMSFNILGDNRSGVFIPYPTSQPVIQANDGGTGAKTGKPLEPPRERSGQKDSRPVSADSFSREHGFAQTATSQLLSDGKTFVRNRRLEIIADRTKNPLLLRTGY